MALLKKTNTAKETTVKKDKKGISKKTSQVLLRPLVTEKSAQLSDRNVVVFEVSTKATKIEIKQAFKEIYGIVPEHVNTVNIAGKRVHFGAVRGKQKNRKKATITLSKDVKFDIFAGK